MVTRRAVVVIVADMASVLSCGEACPVGHVTHDGTESVSHGVILANRYNRLRITCG
jgi:hypothetical protein